MSFTKTLLVVTGIVFGFATLANAAPRGHSWHGYYDNIPGKAQQDKFKNTY